MTLAEQTLTQVGKPVRRIDGAAKVTGRERFAADLQLRGTLYTSLITSPYAHARIIKIDGSAALKVPGVVRVVTAQDLPLVKEAHPSRKRNPLAADKVIFYGQPVAVVLAETKAAAEDGAELVQIEYEALPVVSSLDAALKPDATLVLPDRKAEIPNLPPNVLGKHEFKKGDVAQAFTEAAVIVEKTYRLPSVHQSYIETQNCLVAPDPMGGLTVYASTQALFTTRREVAQALGMPLHKVKVVIPAVGGGFGGKVALIEPLCAALAKLSGRPVALSFSRMQDLAAANPMTDSIFQLKTAANADGTITALQARVWFNAGAYPGSSQAWLAGFKLSAAYPIANLDIETYEVVTNRVGGGAYRAPGGPQSTFALESQVDQMARALGLDPLTIRQRNEAQTLPSMAAVLKRVEQDALWQKRGSLPPNEGIGLALSNWATCMGPASATCRLDDDGNFTVTSGVADISGVSTSLAQIAAEVLGVSLSQITVLHADSDSAPHVGASGGSQITYNLGGAVQQAASDTREQILQLAANALEAAATDLEISGEVVRVKGIASRFVTLQALAAKTTTDYEEGCVPVLGRGSVAYDEWPLTHFAHIAHVRVDPETGDVAVLDYHAIHDVGFAINPAEVEGQIHGGVVQGLGWALYEQLAYDENGTLLTGSFMDYALQIAPLVPKIQVELLSIPSNNGPYGAKGIGEPPIVPGAAAIGNAIFAASGKRITQLPATPERVLESGA